MQGNRAQKNPWERLDHEPLKAYSYFQEYLSVFATSRKAWEDVSAKYNKSYSYIESLAVKWKWKSRAKAYYESLAVEKIEKHKRDFLDFKEHTIAQLKNISYITSARVGTIAKKVKEADGNFEAIGEAVGNQPLSQLIQTLNTSMQIFKSILEKEDAAQGNSPQVEVNVNVGGGVSKIERMTPEDRKAYLEILQTYDDDQ